MYIVLTISMPIPVCVAIDTLKTVLQVDSVEGFRSLMRRVKAGNFNVLYEGAYANAISAILGHYPWVRDLV
jgi:adenylosuccinate synthase